MSVPDHRPSKLEQLAEWYGQRPIIRGLMQFLPGVSAVDTALSIEVGKMQVQRARVYFDELSVRTAPLTEEEIRNEGFLHAYFATTKAALNTKHEEKIRLFARLLSNYAQGSMEEKADDFEEHLAILDDLSFREFQILCTLRRFEENSCYLFGHSDFSNLQSLMKKWGYPADPLAEYLSSLFSDNIKGQFTALDRGWAVDFDVLAAVLIGELNAILTYPHLFAGKPCYPHVALRSETRQLLEGNPKGEQWIKLKRLILEDAYPNEIRTCQGHTPILDKTAANPFIIHQTFWDLFLWTVTAETGVPDIEVTSILERLKRTGLFHAYWGPDTTGDIGHLTPIFERFITALEINSKSGNGQK